MSCILLLREQTHAGGVCRREEVMGTSAHSKSAAHKGRVWLVVVPAGLTAVAAIAQLAAVVVAVFSHH